MSVMLSACCSSIVLAVMTCVLRGWLRRPRPLRSDARLADQHARLGLVATGSHDNVVDDNQSFLAPGMTARPVPSIAAWIACRAFLAPCTGRDMIPDGIGIEIDRFAGLRGDRPKRIAQWHGRQIDIIVPHGPGQGRRRRGKAGRHENPKTCCPQQNTRMCSHT
jgi:hypothetical protein